MKYPTSKYSYFIGTMTNTVYKPFNVELYML